MRKIIDGTPVDGPAPDERPRMWKLTPTCSLQPGEPVVLLGYPVLAEGEHLTEQVPQVRLSWAEWETAHTDYGLAVNGSRMEG